mmetsp:Transcript_55826/g.88474  ORF Transcript_55826/g.88474 Transcript_55826/m.88474 type:complete len:220 (+) Transcript_55826:538-1197(+)
MLPFVVSTFLSGNSFLPHRVLTPFFWPAPTALPLSSVLAVPGLSPSPPPSSHREFVFELLPAFDFSPPTLVFDQRFHFAELEFVFPLAVSFAAYFRFSRQNQHDAFQQTRVFVLLWHDVFQQHAQAFLLPLCTLLLVFSAGELQLEHAFCVSLLASLRAIYARPLVPHAFSPVLIHFDARAPSKCRALVILVRAVQLYALIAFPWPRSFYPRAAQPSPH